MGIANIEAHYTVTKSLHDLRGTTAEESTCYCKSYKEAENFFYSVYNEARCCFFNGMCEERRSTNGGEQIIMLEGNNYRFVVILEEIVSD